MAVGLLSGEEGSRGTVGSIGGGWWWVVGKAAGVVGCGAVWGGRGTQR